ncbi:MAG TPA: hypothetical protein PKY59_17155 [Pyrinomonadaceae bacterium]|nr:hypothetical protein [Pyrinomonadaceae bacterium]
MTTDTQNSYSLAPLGAGDLIDRAVRFYRNNFWTFVLIAAPPVIIGTLFSIGWMTLGREIFNVDRSVPNAEMFFYSLYKSLGNLVIWISEWVITLAVMGGASRNFVRHLLFGEAITFKETYKNTWKRLPGLILASLIIVLLLGFVGFFIFYIGLIAITLLIMLIAYAFSFSPFLIFIVSLVFGIAVAFGTLWLFFLLASRFAYIPQVMLVEGQGVFAAIGRSATLASGNVKRLAALFMFALVATYSALAILYIPLAWYAWANGVEIWSFDNDIIPAWYEIATQVISQGSLILLSPVWMTGLCLLYVDERVRHEGYDIELMAARRLGEIPAVPQSYVNPLQPALSQTNYVPPQNANPAPRNDSFTTLGLK